MMEQFAKRKISVEFTLGVGARGETEGSSVKIVNRRCSFTYLVYNGWMQGQVQLSIWGLPLEMIDQLTTIGPIMTERRNNGITVYAGDEGGKMSVVYKGKIWSAYGDFQSAPDNVFHVMALSAAWESVKPSIVRSYPGEKNIALILEELATEMKLAFENSLLVPVMLRNRYYSGDAVSQIKEICKDANINWTIEKGVLAIWPKSAARTVAPVEISAETGMVGYPMFSSQGVIVTSLFNPDIIQGGKVNIKSSLKVASGLWNIVRVSHQLESEIPGGAWYTQAQCQRLNL